MQKKVIVLGAGLVGGVMAMDLQSHFEVTSVDINEKALEKLKLKGIYTIVADLSDHKILTEIVSSYDLVIGAVPGFMGYKMLETVIKAGKNIVDISFFTEDPFQLD
jgi:saccharopine dehydrogenase-like NADP-dependent oxidoreductase